MLNPTPIGQCLIAHAGTSVQVPRGIIQCILQLIPFRITGGDDNGEISLPYFGINIIGCVFHKRWTHFICIITHPNMLCIELSPCEHIIAVILNQIYKHQQTTTDPASIGAPWPAASTDSPPTGRPPGRHNPCTPRTGRRPAFFAS